MAAGDAIIRVPFSEEGQAGGAETILLVEDEEFIRKVTSEVLESAGYRVVSARCAAEALEAQRTCPEPVDLLLADLVLPGTSGHQLAHEFAGLLPARANSVDERLCGTTGFEWFVSSQQRLPGQALFHSHLIAKSARSVG